MPMVATDVTYRRAGRGRYPIAEVLVSVVLNSFNVIFPHGTNVVSRRYFLKVNTLSFPNAALWCVVVNDCVVEWNSCSSSDAGGVLPTFRV